MADEPEMHEIIGTIAAVGFMLVIGIVFVSLMLTMVGPAGSGDVAIEPQPGTTQVVDSTVGEVPDSATVLATTEAAISFSGSGGYVEASTSDTLTDGSWTVCAAAELADDANQQATATVYAHDNASILLQYDAGNWMAYASNDSHDAKATLDAPAAASGLTPICGRFNATTEAVTISRGSSVSSPATMSTSPALRNVTVAFTGTIDEVREFNASLDDAALQAYAADPIEPRPGTERVSRFMFDEGTGSSTAVYFAGVDGTIHNGTWADGVADPGLSRGTDYELSPRPFSVRAVQVAYLDGAPIMHVRWSDSYFDVGFGWFGAAVSIVSIGLIAYVLRKFSAWIDIDP